MENLENIIRREIEFMFGRRIINARDCIQLSEEIFKVTKSRLNSNTLRRFFRLVKTDYSPSTSTMQILCSYCGFISIDDARNQNNEPTAHPDSSQHESVLNYLINIFREAPVEDKNSETFRSIVKQTILFLDQQPGLVDKFQSAIAKTHNGQDYYFEGFSQIDRLNSCYGNGLRYYLKEKTTHEAQIFGHSLLVFRYWLTENQSNIEKHFTLLQQIGHQPTFSPDTSGRYFASLVYYADAKGYAVSEAMIRIRDYSAGLENVGVSAQIDFDINIAEAFILTDHFEEGLYFVEFALQKLQSTGYANQSVAQNLYLLKAWCMYKTGDLNYAAQLYASIRPTAFNFLKKKMLTILYGVLTDELRTNVEMTENQTSRLINETGFRRLLKLNYAKEQRIRSAEIG